MGIGCVEEYLLGYFSRGVDRVPETEVYLECILILGIAGTRVTVSLSAIVSLLASLWFANYCATYSISPGLFLRQG